MKTMSRFPALLAGLVLLLLSSTAFAGDPPDRVMRLDYINGQVSMQPGGVNDWAAATINRPFTTADRVWTDKDSRAELTTANAAVRMDSDTSLTLTNVTNNTIQLELDQGRLNVSVREMFPGEIYEVDTPNVAFTLMKPGQYSFEVDPNNDQTTVIVRHGEGVGNGNGRGVTVHSNEQAHFLHGDTLMHDIERAPGLDGFDDWCRVRDKRLDNSDSLQYVSAGMIGYQDLDTYGYWRIIPGYGAVWMPRDVAAGWAPYRFGHWVWISPWGWTWVDNEPWGFAPFHYGRWIYTGGYWGWCPGPRYMRPIYAPALVGWVGGRHWGVGVSFGGGVGWFPLGYGEPYYPWYRTSRRYMRNVNITNTRITNINYINNYRNYHNGSFTAPTNLRYANRRVPGGVTVVPRRSFVEARSVNRNMLRISTREAVRAPVMRGADIRPVRTSVLGAGARRVGVTPPSRAFSRPVVSRLTPPQRPAPFAGREGAAVGAGARGIRTPEVNSRAVPQSRAADTARYSPRAVPRPPQSDIRVRSAEGSPRYVPRPPENGYRGATSSPRYQPQTTGPRDSQMSRDGRQPMYNRSAPRPPQNESVRPQFQQRESASPRYQAPPQNRQRYVAPRVESPRTQNWSAPRQPQYRAAPQRAPREYRAAPAREYRPAPSRGGGGHVSRGGRGR